MKKTLIALAATALFAAFTAPGFAQQPVPAQKGQVPSPGDTNLNKKSESGAQTTTRAGAATGAGQPQGAGQPEPAKPGTAKARGQAKSGTDTATGAKKSKTGKKKRSSKRAAKPADPAAAAPK